MTGGGRRGDGIVRRTMPSGRLRRRTRHGPVIEDTPAVLSSTPVTTVYIAFRAHPDHDPETVADVVRRLDDVGPSNAAGSRELAVCAVTGHRLHGGGGCEPEPMGTPGPGPDR